MNRFHSTNLNKAERSGEEEAKTLRFFVILLSTSPKFFLVYVLLLADRSELEYFPQSQLHPNPPIT